MDLTVVIPAFNEAEGIRSGHLNRVSQWLEAYAGSTELIVVDDGSTDDTAALAKPIATRVVTIPHAGKAFAVMAGIRQAQGRLVLFSDMDQATPMDEAPKLLQALDDGAHIAIGGRGMRRKGAPPGRYVLSWGQTFLRKLLFGLPFSDTQCGFKAFRTDAAIAVLDRMRVYGHQAGNADDKPSVTSGFDVELLFVARCLGLKTVEIPVSWHYQDTRRVKLGRDAIRGLTALLLIFWWRLRRGYPKRGNS